MLLVMRLPCKQILGIRQLPPQVYLPFSIQGEPGEHEHYDDGFEIPDLTGNREWVGSWLWILAFAGIRGYRFGGLWIPASAIAPALLYLRPSMDSCAGMTKEAGLTGFGFGGLWIPAFAGMTKEAGVTNGIEMMMIAESLAGFFYFQLEPDFRGSVEEQPQGIEHDGQAAPGGGCNYGGDERVFGHASNHVDGFLAPAFEGVPFGPNCQQQ